MHPDVHMFLPNTNDSCVMIHMVVEKNPLNNPSVMQIDG